LSFCEGVGVGLLKIESESEVLQIEESELESESELLCTDSTALVTDSTKLFLADKDSTDITCHWKNVDYKSFYAQCVAKIPSNFEDKLQGG
jgi:hypothetical protein